MFEKTTLANGIRVVTERMPELHSVSVGFWVETGSRHEDVSLSGISHFLEHMIFRGTKTRSALDIAKEIDSVGGVLNAFTDREFSCYYAKVLGDKLPKAIDILSDLLLNSLFDPEDIEKERKVILQELHMIEDSPDDLIHDLFSESVWRGHPLSYPVIGRVSTVARIKRDDLLQALNSHYRGSNLLVCAAGDVDHHDLVRQVEAAFESFDTSAASGESFVPEHHTDLKITEKDLEQVHLCLGCKGIPQSHPDRFAMNLINSILGASMSSRLFQTVREEYGLAYSIYSYLNSHSDVGSLVIYSGTSPEDVPQLLDVTLEQLRGLKNKRIAEEELQRTKEQLKGGLLLSLESSDNRMSRLAKGEIFLGQQYGIHEIIDGIERVTPDIIMQLANSLFVDDSLNLQLIGRVDSSQFSADALNLS
ncbi:MAG TPA: pitrilysin family protein [Geopsychrobacteraceae bacterium]|nr:pitrilysin family protein [Geopsychrobacteraceae bacterium]